MATSAKQMFLKKVLREVNVYRTILGMKPIRRLPKGHLGSTVSCPIARALDSGSTGAQSSTLVVDGTRVEACHTPVLQQFIRNFDAGSYPALIDRE